MGPTPRRIRPTASSGLLISSGWFNDIKKTRERRFLHVAPGARNFDLNIEKILEGWEVRHAVREVIANALDEQVLSHTQDISIATDASGNWHIRDFGRGLRYEYLTQNENAEKRKNAG